MLCVIERKSVLLPNKLYAKIKHLDNGAKIILTITGNKINDVNEL